MKHGWKVMALTLLCLLCVGMARAEDFTEGLTPVQMLMQARSMFPMEKMTVQGKLGTAQTRGQRETLYPYVMELDWAGNQPKAVCRLYDSNFPPTVIQTAELTRVLGKPDMTLVASDGTRVEHVALNTPIANTELTWMDLAFDYLWWTDVRRLDDEALEALDLSAREGGRNCVVLEARPPENVRGLSVVRMWIDRGSGNLLQVQQVSADGASVRTLYVQRIGRENERWVPREFRVSRKGIAKVTKLYVDRIDTATFSTEAE